MDTRAFNLPRYLSLLPLFSDLSPDELQRLATGCSLKRLQRGELVFRCGDPCDAFHVCVTGQVKLFVLSPAGQELFHVMGRVPTSLKVKSNLNNFPYVMIDPVTVLDESEKWETLWNMLFLKNGLHSALA